jgi:hypothetical protein
MDPDLLSFVGVMVTFATVGLGGYTAIRVINLVLGRLEAKGSPMLTAELDELRARVEELEAERARLVELEERVDFTERVLAGDAQGRNLEAPQ